MEFRSFSSTNPSAYRLGVEMAQAFEGFRPELILLFASVDFADFDEIYAALKDCWGDQCPEVIGGTGDGIYETNLVSESAVSALAIRSKGGLKWKVALQSLEEQSTYQATEKALSEIKSVLPDFNFVFVLSDFGADGMELVRAINENSNAKAFGGFVADNRELKEAFVTVNGSKLTRHLLFLGIESQRPIEIFNGSGYRAEGKAGKITSCEGTTITSIDGESPLEFIKKGTSRHLSVLDLGVMGFEVSPAGDPSVKYLRAASNFDYEKDQLQLFAGVSQGDKIQFCTAQKEDLVDGVRKVLVNMKERNIKPLACLIVSCAGRKWQLGNQIDHEVALLVEEVGTEVPIVGFPSLGEISPIRTQSGQYENHFHNVTYVLVVFGE